MNTTNEWLLEQIPEYTTDAVERIANRDREALDAARRDEAEYHRAAIQQGLAQIALRIESGRVRIWQDEALCSTPAVDTAIFEPQRKDRVALELAKRYCDNCRVFEQCDAAVKGRRGGGMVWAGKLRQ